MSEKVRYSDAELEEFRQVILQKLELAKRDYDEIMRALRREDSNDVADTSPTYKGLEDGSDAAYLEEQMQIAGRQAKFIQGLQAALIRIENKTYGVCRETGKLIAKERLMAVPHATLSIEAKKNR
jgi:RNA polymerase-binding protein DksA